MTASAVSEASYSGLDVVAKSPKNSGFSADLAVLSMPDGRASEAFGALRTHLLAQHFQLGRRALAVCAASRGAGCSFVAANLALSLARTGVKTMLIDADLRAPSLDGLFGAPPGRRGLAHCLVAEGDAFSSFYWGDLQPNLSVMFAGGAPDNPQELLAGDRFSALTEFCLREFEATIFDTPPANICADARRVSTAVGYSLIVARKDTTYVSDIATLQAQLTADHARVIGTVLNGA